MPRTAVAFLLLLAITSGLHHAQIKRPPRDPTPSQTDSASSVQDSARLGYVGNNVCGSCHQDKLRTFMQTVHHRTSALPSAQSIAGSFAPPDNIMETMDPGVSFKMDARNGEFYQTAIIGNPLPPKERTEKLAIVVGSGGKGQTYLYWKGDQLFELPVSYWTELHRWVNSPGYLDGTANFDRPVIARCVECHATFFQPLSSSPPMNRYNKTDFVLGISCERCHGPGQEHVARHQGKPGTRAEEAIVNPAKLSRDRQVDVCAQCHAGLGEEIAPAFSFKAGEPLGRFIRLEQPPLDSSVDVHGNQVALLERSQCFQSSANMTCSTCHDEHAPEPPAATGANHCLTCHQPQKCGLYAKLGAQIAKNCVGCHMPVQTSNLIVSDVNGRGVRAKVRNHWIKVYPKSPGN